MLRWSLVAEFFAFIILAILFLRYYCWERKVAYTTKRKYYLICLSVSACSILINALCVHTIAHADKVPMWINLLLNSLYFWLSVMMCSLLAFYLFIQLLEHVYDKHCLRRAFISVALLTAVFTVLVVWNLNSGILFYFDSNGNYQRGILNAAGYGIMVIEMILLIICYIRNYHSVSRPMGDIILSLPPMAFLLVLFQLFNPEILMNGMAIAITNLIIFISFQSRTLDRDSLTGIRNRNNLYTELSLRLGSRQKIHIMMVYLQKFSDINQKYGYQTGDSILYEIAGYFERLFPAGRAFRFGNVTFALVLPYESEEYAQTCRTRIMERFREAWVLGDIQCYIPCNIADLVYTDQEWTSSQIIEYLEYSLDMARQTDWGNVHFDIAINQQLQRKKYLIETMRCAIRDKRFKVWYQPIYCCDTGKFSCAEALLRLTDYNGETVSPEIFIPLSEETGMIEDLSWIVLEEICKLLCTPQGAHLKYISLNISLQSFLNPGLAEAILSCLKTHGLTPDRIKIEITERVLLHDMMLARSQMDRLVSSGIQIYIDDFGTGYSNFAFVLDSPFECVKIDRSLVKDILTDTTKDLTVKTLMKLFHEIGKELVIEGVENELQARRLKEYGADMIQGFYYARPMPEEEFLEFNNRG